MDGSKIVLILLCINIMFYIGGFHLIEGDLLSNFINTDTLSTTPELNEGLTSTIQKDVRKGIIADITQTFFDGLGLVYQLLLLFVNLASAPLVMFIGTGLHPTIALMIGVPLAVAEFIAIGVLIRGGGW